MSIQPAFHVVIGEGLRARIMNISGDGLRARISIVVNSWACGLVCVIAGEGLRARINIAGEGLRARINIAGEGLRARINISGDGLRARISRIVVNWARGLVFSWLIGGLESAFVFVLFSFFCAPLGMAGHVAHVQALRADSRPRFRGTLFHFSF